MSDRVLVTGGFGFLGGRIAVALSGNSKVRLGTRTPKTPAWLPAAELVALDLASGEGIREACRDVRSIVHLAALNEIECGKHPEQALLVNGLGTLKLLNAAIEAGVERFLYLSTAHVYGNLAGSIDERTLSRPLHPYAISHRTAEDFVLAAHDRGQITGLCLRLSNAFGAPTHSAVERWTLIFNDLCRQTVTTGKLVLKTAGLQRRDFIPLADVTAAVTHLLGLEQERCLDGLFNLGGECTLSMLEVAQRIAARCEKVLGFTPPIVAPPPPPDARSEALVYRIDKLKGTGFLLRGEMDAEIDALLTLCQRSFGGAR